MAYENINVTSLRSSINSCLNSINYTKINQIINQISSNDIWNADSKSTFKNALEKLIDRNEQLEKELKNYLNVVNLIEEYQKLDTKNVNSSSDLSNINKELSVLNQIDRNYSNQGKQNSNEAINNRQKITNLNNKINNINSKINSNKNEMNSLKSKIDAMI